LNDLGVTLQIVPNPTAAFASLLVEGSNIGNGKIEVIDVTGRVVRQFDNPFETGSSNINIETENLQNGVYTIRLSTENGQLTKKLVVQH
jgi:hypothetical protein